MWSIFTYFTFQESYIRVHMLNTVYDAAKKKSWMTFLLAAKLEAKQKLMEQTDIVIILRAVWRDRSSD